MTDVAAFFAAVQTGATARVQGQLAESPALALARHGGATALHVAAIGTDPAMVDVLLDAGADLNARDETYQMTPIGWANDEGRADMVRYLHARGAEIDLHQAAAYGLLEQVRESVKHTRRQVNAMMGGWTPLHLATLWGRREVVELLLSRGGDPLVRDPYGRTSLEIARGQVESQGAGTPRVRQEQREEIVAACAQIAELLAGRGPRA